MKIPKETRDAMARMIEKGIQELGLDWQTIIEAYEAGQFPRSEHVKDLNKRFRWDLAWAFLKDDLQVLYEGYTDAHIDTALQSIVPTITRRY